MWWLRTRSSRDVHVPPILLQGSVRGLQYYANTPIRKYEGDQQAIIDQERDVASVEALFRRSSPFNAQKQSTPAVSKVVRAREFVVLEGMGRTFTSTGEQIGYHIMHSVTLACTPPLKASNVVRGICSAC